MAEIKQIKIRLPEDLSPVFVNLARVSHTPGEFVMDFSSILPGVEIHNVVSRLVLSPLGAKSLMQVLSESVRSYESKFGEIRMPHPPSLAEDLFGQPGNPSSEGS